MEGIGGRSDRRAHRFWRRGRHIAGGLAIREKRFGLQEVAEGTEKDRNSSRGVEVLNQLGACRFHVNNHRDATSEAVHVVQVEVHREPTGEGREVKHGVCGPTDGIEEAQGVAKRSRPARRKRAFALKNALGDAHARLSGALVGPGVARGNGARPGNDEAEHFSEYRHGGRGAHGVAGTGPLSKAGFELAPCGVVQCPGTPLVPQAPQSGSRADPLATEVTRGAGPSGDDQGGKTGARSTHQRAGHGLVAIREQDHAIERVSPQHFLDLDGKEVAIQHRRRLHEVLAERDDGEFDRQTARGENSLAH